MRWWADWKTIVLSISRALNSQDSKRKSKLLRLNSRARYKKEKDRMHFGPFPFLYYFLKFFNLNAPKCNGITMILQKDMSLFRLAKFIPIFVLTTGYQFPEIFRTSHKIQHLEAI